jgi:hypothetical protein
VGDAVGPRVERGMLGWLAAENSREPTETCSPSTAHMPSQSGPTLRSSPDRRSSPPERRLFANGRGLFTQHRASSLGTNELRQQHRLGNGAGRGRSQRRSRKDSTRDITLAATSGEAAAIAALGEDSTRDITQANHIGARPQPTPLSKEDSTWDKVSPSTAHAPSQSCPASRSGPDRCASSRVEEAQTTKVPTLDAEQARWARKTR